MEKSIYEEFKSKDVFFVKTAVIKKYQWNVWLW